MTCRCGETKKTLTKHAFRRTVADSTFTAEATVEACASCLEPNVPLALVIAFERALAAELARRGPISGETFRWIRKAAGLERVDLTKMLGVTMEVLAAWEEERRPIDLAAWTMVATLVLDAYEGPRSLRTRINARRRRTESGVVARSRSASATSPSVTPLTLDRANARTIAKVLELLSGPIAFTDVDIADALDVDLKTLRATLRNLAVLGLVTGTSINNSSDDGSGNSEGVRHQSQGDVGEAATTAAAGADVHATSLRWDPSSRDRTTLFRAAKAAGVDLDTQLPRAKPDEGIVPSSRITSVSWRAAT